MALRKYYNVNIVNKNSDPSSVLATNDKQLVIDQSLGESFISDTKNYSLSIVRFAMRTRLPIFTPTISLITNERNSYVITTAITNGLGEITSYASAMVDWVPSGYGESKNPDYTQYDAYQVVQSINNALDVSATITGVPKPVLRLNSTTQRIELAFTGTGSNNYFAGGVSGSYPGAWPASKNLIFCNSNLYNLLSAFSFTENLQAVNYSGAINNTCPPARLKYLMTLPLEAATATNFTFISRQNPFDRWCDYSSILITSTNIGIQPENLSTATVTQNAILPQQQLSPISIITDFVVPPSDICAGNAFYEYLPTAEFRRMTMSGLEFKQLNLQVSRYLNNGTLAPIILKNDDSFSIKLYFEKI